jgi:hypothetical protein
MKLSDVPAPDLDPQTESIVVLFNATPTTKYWSEPALRGLHYRLHKVQRTSEDELTTQAQFVPGQGTFRVPPRTTAVFVEGN